VQEFKNLVVLAVLAAFLVVGVVVAAAANPYALLGLAPVLLGIAAIVRAVGGGRHGEDDRGEKPRKTRAKAARTSVTAGRNRGR
jgi:hypothetical protein